MKIQLIGHSCVLIETVVCKILADGPLARLQHLDLGFERLDLIDRLLGERRCGGRGREGDDRASNKPTTHHSSRHNYPVWVTVAESSSCPALPYALVGRSASSHHPGRSVSMPLRTVALTIEPPSRTSMAYDNRPDRPQVSASRRHLNGMLRITFLSLSTI